MMTEVSVEACFANLKVLSFSLNNNNNNNNNYNNNNRKKESLRVLSFKSKDICSFIKSESFIDGHVETCKFCPSSYKCLQ